MRQDTVILFSPTHQKPLLLHLFGALPFINQMPGLFTIADADSKLLAANNTSLDWWGYHRAEKIVGLSYCNFPCKISELHYSLVEQDKIVLNTSKPLRIIGRFCYAKDSWKVLFGQKYPIKNEHNEIIGIVADFNEITHYPIFDFLHIFGVFDKIVISLIAIDKSVIT